jgi:hypothetical protein
MKILPIVLLAAATPVSAFGWGCEGHQMVALIASQHLTEEARTAVYQLLQENPIDPSLSRFCQPVATEPMADASTWADDSKRGEKTGTWHYLDIPRGVEHAELMKYCAPVGDPAANLGAGKDRPGCLLTGLQYEFDILKDRNRTPAERATALRYVIHFVGDLHQPLHTTTNDDQGGNCTSVTLFEDPKRGNLHGAWDYGIIGHFLKQANQTPAQLATQLDQRFQSKGQGWLHEPIDFGKWIWEGHHIAEKVTYDKLHPKPPVAPAENGPGCAAERDQTTALKIDIDAKYAGAAMPVIERQLAKAGYRLAEVLNAALAASPSR